MDDLLKEITGRLAGWYQANRRDLPWRETSDPYCVWLSEVILQQTRVAQGMGYYHRFMERFPTVAELATAELDEVLKLWQGLGYYSRARNLHAAAKVVAERYSGRFPADYGALRALPGVGDYTASAVASIAFGLPCAVVDGNVQRVLARVFGIDLPVDGAQGKRAFAVQAQALLDPLRPGLSNQALMEFGALQCVPKNPDCGGCVLGALCVARRQGAVERLPVKKQKAAVKTRWFNYLVISDGERVLLSQRVDKDIWRGLWEFPLIEGGRALDYAELASEAEFGELMDGAGGIALCGSRAMPPHLLSHREIRAVFYRIRVERFTPAMEARYKVVPLAELGEYAVSRLIERYLVDI